MIGDHHQVRGYIFFVLVLFLCFCHYVVTLTLSFPPLCLSPVTTSSAEHGFPEVLQHGAEHVHALCETESADSAAGCPGQSTTQPLPALQLEVHVQCIYMCVYQARAMGDHAAVDSLVAQ